MLENHQLKNRSVQKLIKRPDIFQYLVQRQAQDESGVLDHKQTLVYLLCRGLKYSIENGAVEDPRRGRHFWSTRAFFMLYMCIGTIPECIAGEIENRPAAYCIKYLTHDQAKAAGLHKLPASHIVAQKVGSPPSKPSCFPCLSSSVENKTFIQVYNPLNAIWHVAFVEEKGLATRPVYQSLYYLAETFSSMGWGRELPIEDLRSLKEQIGASSPDVAAALRSADPAKVLTVLSRFQHALEVGRKIEQQTQHGCALLQTHLPLPLPLVSMVGQYIGVGFFASPKPAQPESSVAPPPPQKHGGCAIL